MPIQSMTGFGRAASGEDGFDYVVEIRSVNHRYLDVRVRLPRSLQESEGFIKSSLSQRVVRGRVDVTVTARAEMTLVRSLFRLTTNSLRPLSRRTPSWLIPCLFP